MGEVSMTEITKQKFNDSMQPDTLTIEEIKSRYEAGEGNRFFFSPDTMKFFNQRLSDFRVKKLTATKFLIFAPSYWYDMNHVLKLMGISQKVFDTTDNDLHDVPDKYKISKKQYIKKYMR